MSIEASGGGAANDATVKVVDHADEAEPEGSNEEDTDGLDQ